MTDDTRKLIEEGSTPSGPGDFASAEDEADYWRNYAMRLRAALEVSLPTEDDREALRAIISEAESQTDDEGEWALPEDVADAILDAGFRRAPVPPETDRAVIERVARILAPRTDPEGGWRGYIGIARQLAGAGLLAAVPPETDEARRFNADDKATLIDTAAARIQAVWDDVGATDARTLAENVVSAQEFAWLSMHFPIQRPAPVPPETDEEN